MNKRVKNTGMAVVLCVLLVNSVQASFLKIGIFTDMNFSNTETTVVFDVNNPGSGSFDFWTVINTDNLPISGLEYNVKFPTVGWTLNEREYGDSWIEVVGDTVNGAVNNSIPLPGDILTGGVLVTEGLYTGTRIPNTAIDFHFASKIEEEAVIAQSTDVVVERFNVSVPLNLTLGSYTFELDFDNLVAVNLDGNSILEFEGQPVNINYDIKNLNLSVIPEPGTFSLFLVTLVALASIRSRRKNAVA